MNKVAVNTRLLLKGRLEGLGTYADEVLQRLVRNHPTTEFHFIFDRPYDASFIYGPNVIPHVLSPQARHPFLFITWFDYRIPALLKKIKPDLFFSPDGYLSTRTTVKQIPVIHDINFFHYPEYFNFWVRWHFNTYFPQFAKKAEKIITISEFSKQDIVKNYRIDAAKIEVAYNGVDQTPLLYSMEDKEEMKMKYANGSSYFISVGALYPRKNLSNQMKAFDAFKTATGADVKFLIAGQSYPESDSIYETHSQLKHRGDVKLLGRISRSDLDILVAGAIASSYVSNFEGFGLPVLEAMRCGTPVITSNTTALPEVTGEAALLVDPTSVKEISDAYKKLFEDVALRHALAAKGNLQFKKFTWDETAKKVGAVLGLH